MTGTKSTFRKLTTQLSLLAILVIALAFTINSGYASSTDCEKGGAVDRAGHAAGDAAFSNCCDVWGCDNGPGNGTNYCFDQADEAYNAYVFTHGCPNLMY